MNNPILNLIKSIAFGVIFGIISIYLIGIFFPNGEGTEIFIGSLAIIITMFFCTFSIIDAIKEK